MRAEVNRINTDQARAFPSANHYWMLRIAASLCLLALLLVSIMLIIGRLLPESAQVAYETASFTGSRQRRIYLMDIGHALSVPLINEMDNIVSMNWSPDGRQVVYATARASERPQMYVMDVLTRQSVALPNDLYSVGSSVSWSPDGRLITFMAAVNSRAEIAVLDLGLGAAHVLDVYANLYAVPTWAPDSQALLYLAPQPFAEQSDRSGLYAVPINCYLDATPCENSRVHLLPTVDVYAYSWTRDGNKLVFNGIVDGRVGVYTASMSCSTVLNNCLGEPELIRATSMYYIQPFWSPSGTQIAYRDEIKQVKVLDVQTGVIHQFETTSVDKTELIWSNDGRQLIYEGLSRGTADLFTVNIQTGEERQLTVSGNEEHRPKLRPD